MAKIFYLFMVSTMEYFDYPLLELAVLPLNSLANVKLFPKQHFIPLNLDRTSKSSPKQIR